MMNSKKIQDILQNKFSPDYIKIVDDSERHLGHAGQKESGGSHYTIILVSDSFEGKTLLERHRAVYDAVEMDRSESIHAFALKVYTSKEWSSKNPNQRWKELAMATFVKAANKNDIGDGKGKVVSLDGNEIALF